MNEKNYLNIWNQAISELSEEYKNAGQEKEFSAWFNMNYISEKDNIITISVESEFIRQQMLKKGNFKTVEDKLKKITSNDNLKIECIIADAEPEKENNTDNINSYKNKTKNNSESTVEKTLRKKHPALREEFTFDNFIPGDNSNFAYKASIEVAKNPGTYKNPILLYGSSGLGKTHLMQAIGNYIRDNSEQEMKICYITAEDFTNEFTSSLNTKSAEKFKSKYRSYDVLLVDDIHFLNNKKETQEQLFWTFEKLKNKNSQMVFTCDRPINEIKGMTERLVSRLSSGLPIDLNPPAYETRVAILKKKLELMNKTIDEEIINFIAQNIESNVRDLEGALNKIVGYADLVDKNVTLEIAKEQLKNLLTFSQNENIKIITIQKVVSDSYQISLADMKTKKRDRKFAFPRQIAMFIAHTITEFTYQEIGNEFGGKDHSTIMHNCEKIENFLKTDHSLKLRIENLIREIKETK